MFLPVAKKSVAGASFHLSNCKVVGLSHNNTQRKKERSLIERIAAAFCLSLILVLYMTGQIKEADNCPLEEINALIKWQL